MLVAGDWHRDWYMTQLWTVKGDYEKGFLKFKKGHKELKVPLLSKTLLYLPMMPRIALVICNHDSN